MSLIPQIPPHILMLLRPYWRRRWTMVAIAWLLAIVGWVFVASLPDRYQASARIYVDTQNMLTPLLRDITVQTDIRQQIQVLQRTLLNRSNVAQVANVTNMDLEAVTEQQKDRLYSSLINRISIRAEGNNLFSIFFGDTDPQLAKTVVETILNLFVETNLGQNRTSMENAANFLEEQIHEYEQKLKQADERLAEYKAQHITLLQATGANFSARIDTVRQRVTEMQSRFDHALVTRDLLQKNLVETPQLLEVSSPQMVAGGGSSRAAAARARVAKLRQQLADLKTRYTDSYPDVVNTQRELNAAEAALASVRSRATVGPQVSSIPNPVFEQLTLNLVDAESDLARAKIDLDAAKAELVRLEDLGQTAPAVEADLADLTRQYSVIKDKYEELLTRRESARISEAVEASGDQVQFRIIEAPHVPPTPSFPNRAMLSTVVLLLALGAGAGAIFLLHKLEDTIDDASVLTNEFHVPVLGSVPRVDSVARRWRRRRNGFNFALACISLVIAYLAVILTSQLLHLPEMVAGVRDHLPPFAQTIIQEVLQHVGQYLGP